MSKVRDLGGSYAASGMGSHKHGMSGTVHNVHHFTGPTRGKPTRRKGKGLTRKQRRLKRGTARNKYKE